MFKKCFLVISRRWASENIQILRQKVSKTDFTRLNY